MKKVMVLVVLAVALFSKVASADIVIDMSTSTTEIVNGTIIRVHHVTAQGYPGTYQADLQWDQVNRVLRPVAVEQDYTTPPSQSLVGTYQLVGFYVLYSNGTAITDKDVSFSGTMTLGTDSTTQTLTINSNPFVMSGVYTPTYTNEKKGGLFAISDSSGYHTIIFWTDGYDLSTFSGEVTLTNGVTYQEWDYWKKVNDSTSVSAQSSSNEQTQNSPSEQGGLFTRIGQMLNR